MADTTSDDGGQAAVTSMLHSTHLENGAEVDGEKGEASNPYVEVASSPGKGLGLFAIKDIKRGTRILAEVPLIATKPGEQQPHLHVHEEFEKLTPQQLSTLSELHHEEHPFAAKQSQTVRDRLSATKQYRGRVLDLAVENEMKLQAIFTTNSVFMGYGRR